MVVNRSTSDSKIFQTEMDTPPPSRGALRPSLATCMPLDQEGAGNAGCLSQHPRPHVQMKKAHEPKSPQVRPNHRHSLRDGVNGFLRALPGDRAFLPPSSARCESTVANLTPASGRQNHTTSPSALIAVRPPTWRVHRIPRPTSVTTRTPLLSRRDASK